MTTRTQANTPQAPQATDSGPGRAQAASRAANGAGRQAKGNPNGKARPAGGGKSAPADRGKAAPADPPGTVAARKAARKVAEAAPVGRRIQVRKSGVHGKGVFVVQPIKKGELVIEYTGEVISWDEALRRHPHDPSDPNHTFYFHIDAETVIDGARQGNSARWINHACDPNCEAEIDEGAGRVFIHALRSLKPGEELFFDYGLVIEDRYTPALKKQFACWCGAKTCRGTMLAPKRQKLSA